MINKRGSNMQRIEGNNSKKTQLDVISVRLHTRNFKKMCD